MSDRPSAAQLINAVSVHLQEAVIPAVRADHKLYFQTLVAINVLRIVEREMALGPDHARAEWARLNDLLGQDEAPSPALSLLKSRLAERNAQLSQSIRAGEYETNVDQPLFAHLIATAIEQLQIANPRFLQKLQQEDADPTLDAWVGR